MRNVVSTYVPISPFTERPWQPLYSSVFFFHVMFLLSHTGESEQVRFIHHSAIPPGTGTNFSSMVFP